MSREIINKLFNNKIKQFIFIYTPPKVGSTTLVSSLRISLSNLFNVIHIHTAIWIVFINIWIFFNVVICLFG